jgi:spoIIIJ-associated protein
VEFVEVKGRTVDVAVEAALAELGLPSADKAEIEVLQQPERGFLGLGGREAIVRVRAKGEDTSARKRRSRKPRSSSSGGRKESGASKPAQTGEKPPPSPKPATSGRDSVSGSRGPTRRERNPESEARTDAPELTIEEQASVVEEFLTGLLAAYGLDGTVDIAVDDEIILATVAGDQTEALVGAQGVVMDAVHEVCRTVLQRRSRHAARLRIDIAGYAERRRQALRIYATRLAEQVTEEGGEIMLEPMNASDRKVIHDAISEIASVRSYSEGEPPDRYVVIAVDAEDAEDAEPGASVPEEGVPETSAPDEGVPETSAPEEGVPETSVPDTSAPEEGAPEESGEATPVEDDVLERDAE